MNLYLVILLLTAPLFALTHKAEEWRSRVLYQIVTDRFANTDGSPPKCNTLLEYCGGTFKGIQNNLDYIQGMGANAIWISPVGENAPGSYHGYHYTNFYKLNENFGTEQDFKDLIEACHERDIWVMVDVVPNHVAPVPNNTDFSSIYPFNDAKYYHYPIVDCEPFFYEEIKNQSAMEYCWLWGLPDLRHEDEFVTQTLLNWIRDFVGTYPVDGLRVDAVRHVPMDFWYKFSEAAGIFLMGEVFDDNMTFVAQYQDPLDSLLNFPLQSKLYQSFLNDSSMVNISDYYSHSSFWKDTRTLANFIDNHDIPRYLHNNTGDVAGLKAVYTFLLTALGIPAIYYGDEQSFDGGIDPANREVLWGKMDTNAEIYQHLRTIINFRQKTKLYELEQTERQFDDEFYSFSRGQYFFTFSKNFGEIVREVVNHPYTENTVICNVLGEKECVEVKEGKFQIVLKNKEVKIFVAKEKVEEKGGLASAFNMVKDALKKVIPFTEASS